MCAAAATAAAVVFVAIAFRVTAVGVVAWSFVFSTGRPLRNVAVAVFAVAALTSEL